MRTTLLGPFALLMLFPLAPETAAQGAPPGFEEQFALAIDRSAVLERLVPGTPDYYYFHCLHAQNSGDLAAVQPLVDLWVKRHGRGGRVQEIENRQALLTYDSDPRATYAYLREKLGLRFDHQRASGGEAPDLPTVLDPQGISAEAFRQRALARHRNSLAGFTDAALPGLVAGLSARELNDERLTELLRRLERPDVPGLVPLVLRELGLRSSRGFGSLAVHQRLLLDQLEACAAQRPQLLEVDAFITAYVRRLKPGADVRWEQDPDARGAYLARLEAFTARLAPAHNTLKAHVLYHRLAHDLAAGAPDKQRFMAYLRLPRQGSYVEPEFLRRTRRGDEMAQLGADFPTGLDPVGDDEPLVRAYFTHFLVGEDSIEPYAPFVRRDWVQRLFAETKILAGRGDMERWYSLLDSPEYLEQLERRVELSFPPEQRVLYAPDEEVVLEVDVKNVETLLVKVFEINTVDYHTELGREVDASIELDGLVPNAEATHTYTDPPLRRVRRRFPFPALEEPGTYVVEFIGGGLSSRAVIRKGGLRAVERVGSAGHVFRVVDSEGEHVPDAALRLGGREFTADEAGEILVPFTTDPGEKTIVLRRGTRSSLARFRHLGEKIELSAGVFVERESLLEGERAELVVRPALQINGRTVDLGLLEEPLLRVVSSGRDGVPATLEVRDLELGEEGELVQEFRVPDGLRRLEVSLHGELRDLTRGDVRRLSSPARVFTLNGIDATPATYSPLLGRTADGYVLDVLGKNGEPRAGEPVHLEVRRTGFSEPFSVTLQTSAAGRVRLGPLEGIEHVRASGFPSTSQGWRLDEPARDLPRVLHGLASATLRVPYQGGAAGVQRSTASLLELRDGLFARDRFDHLALRAGFLELRDLPAGDYDLYLPEAGRRVLVRVTEGRARGRWAYGRDRYLELRDAHPLHLVGSGVEGDGLVLRLANADADTRVHVASTRYLPAYDLFACLRAPADPNPEVVLGARPESDYHAGRAIGDEYRYILERRFATVFPGNMLTRPSLLLNPWALEETEAVLGAGGGAGGKFGGRAGGKRTLRAAGGAASEQALGEAPGEFPDLGFLPAQATLLTNLRPDPDGVLRVPLADLGPGQHVHVLAADGRSTVRHSLALEERPLAPRDRRLADAALDPARHVIEQRRLEVLDAGAEVVLSGGATTGATTYDSLDDVHRLYRALTGDEDLARFAFVLRWPSFSDDEKRELYGEHACHELHVFLHEKDPEFFDGVVRPYLANKRHHTFLDAWLLDEDLTRYRDPWAFGQLNTVERILLTRRLAGERANGARRIRELFELLPPDPAGAARLFDAALGGDALAAEGADLMEELEAVYEKSKRAERPAGPATPGPVQPPAAARGRAATDEEEDLEVAAGEPAAPADSLLDEKQERRAGEERDLARRKQSQQLWRALDATKAYVEHEYWHRRRGQARGDWIPTRGFWLDFAQTPEGAPFHSPRFAEPTGSFGEMMLALAFLDLPFEAAAPSVETQEGRLVLRPSAATLLVRRELADAPLATDAPPLLLSQDLYRFDDRIEFVDGEQRDKFVRDEFLMGVTYGCRVVLTNPTSTPRELELLVQVPAGAIPVNGARATRGVTLRVEAYGIATHEYAFYFPVPGLFPHYPAHAAHDGALVAFAAGTTLNVVAQPSAIDTSSWEHVTQEGSAAEVLAFLAQANPFRLDLARPAWRLRERAFYDAYVGALRARHLYDPTSWSYGILHGDAATAAEYLRHQDGFLSRCGHALESPLLSIDPVERLAYQHVEFHPLVNPRAHPFAGRREILDQGVKSQWARHVAILAQRPALESGDWLSVTYYLLLQDRIEEALGSFRHVDPEDLGTRLQYDYMDAYLDFFGEQARRARGIAERYSDHPVPRWRALFREMLAHLDEAEGRTLPEDASDDPRGLADRLAAEAPALELAVDGGRVTVSYANLRACTVNYYPMDVEFLFSTNPFVQQGGGGSSFVRPARSDVLALAADGKSTTFALPADLARGNMLVEVRAGGLVRRQAVYVGHLDVQVMESHGQLRVTGVDDGKPRSKVYVKVYAHTHSGEVRFHKDGYTDHRGRFDYASMTGPRATDAERYALLVLDEEAGAAIREVAPPTR